MIELLFNLLKKADTKALENINSNSATFKEFIESEIVGCKGLKWDDLIVRFEWSLDINKNVNKSSMSENHVDAYNRAYKMHKC